MSRILVVEDDPHVARTLVELLRRHGYAAERADSGEEGLERLAGGAFDLVLLDLRLPGIDGFEACARIREAHGPSVPVIIVTAFGDAESLRRGYEAGADDFLQKPVDTPALILKVRAFLRLKSLHDQLLESREQARARARDLAALYEIGRDWSLIAEPEEFHRTVTQRLAGLIGAPICGIALYESTTEAETFTAALPVHGVSDEAARRLSFARRPEYRGRWPFRTGRPYLTNDARRDPLLDQRIMEQVGISAAVLVPMLSEGHMLGLLVAANKPGGFSEEDVQILSIFAGPAATFLRSRQIFDRARRHAARLERVAALVGEMAATTGRARLLELTIRGMQKDLGYERVAFYGRNEAGFRLELESGPRGADAPTLDADLLRWALRSVNPLPASNAAQVSELAVPVRAGDQALGVVHVVRRPPAPFADEEISLLATLAGQLALALQRAGSAAATERMARQMATLYDLGLEISPLRDLQLVFTRAAAEAGRLIQADHVSVFRLLEAEAELHLYATWASEPGPAEDPPPSFRLGEGIAGRVARDRVPALVNDVESHGDGVPRERPVSRMLCVPLTYYDQEREAPAVFGVLNVTRRSGSPAFAPDDLEYLTRFASQLSIAVANWVAYEAERERSEQLALVNVLLREIAGALSPDRILERAVRLIHRAFGHPVVTVVVPDAGAGLWRVAAAAARDPRPEGWAGHPLGAGIAGRARRERGTVLLKDVTAERGAAVPALAGIRSQLAVPILSGDEVVAVLQVESEDEQAFKRAQVITFQTLADGIGIMLRNAELYQTLERTNARLVELDRTKSDLLNIVAHDFRAPLASIMASAELLEWKPDAPSAERVERAQVIVGAAGRMANLVSKTLTTTRLETGQLPFEFALVDVGALVREVAARQPASPQHPLALELPDHPLPCWADADRVGEVVENLLSNAVKYTPRGGPVRVALRREGETAVVEVTDHGIGIAPADRERLFRPFFRVRNESTAGIEGFGLGLSICERIIRAHGGRLTVQSVPDQGSTFCFSLPLFGAAALVSRPIVLVAAGDAATRREVRRVAEELGYNIHEVTDGVEAVEAALRLRPAAVVLDRILPRLAAEEVAERLHGHAGTDAMPLFVLAPREDLGVRAELFRACVPKPLDRDALAAALEELVRSVP